MMRRLATVLMFIAALLFVPLAHADTVPAFEISVQMGSGAATVWNPTGVANPDGTFSYDGSNGNANWTMDFNFLLNPDPGVSGSFAVQNGTGSTQTFTIVFTMPIAPLPGPNVMGGSTQEGV